MNYYPEVMDLLRKGQDWEHIVFEIAKRHPKLVLSTIEDISSDWRQKAKRLYFEDGEKIEAIKYCRAMTGMGLKEAKDAVEAL